MRSVYKEQQKLYEWYNSNKHRQERITDIFEKIKDETNFEKWYKSFRRELKDVARELYAKQFKNSMWNCHD